MGRAPLNGTKTHPLTEHGYAALAQLNVSSSPAQYFNPGVVNRLLREDLAELVRGPSPFKRNRGELIDYLAITDAGRQALKDSAHGS